MFLKPSHLLIQAFHLDDVVLLTLQVHLLGLLVQASLPCAAFLLSSYIFISVFYQYLLLLILRY